MKNARNMIAPLAVAALLTAGSVLADDHEYDHDDDYATTLSSFTDRARVISVEPVYRIVRVPRRERECREVTVYHEEHAVPDRIGVGTLTGAIVGGVIGSQVGKGHGRRAATVAGTIIGTMIGRDIERRQAHASSTSEVPHVSTRCETRVRYEEREELDGYRVTFRYRGRTFTRMMDHDPGRFVRVRVQVSAL